MRYKKKENNKEMNKRRRKEKGERKGEQKMGEKKLFSCHYVISITVISATLFFSFFLFIRFLPILLLV